MIKKFNIRLYSFTGNFKRQITDFGWKVQWSENINGWQGDLYMDVLDTSDMVQWDIIEITESSDTDKSIKPSYTGIIEYIEDEHSSDWKTYSVQVFWTVIIKRI